MNTEIDWNQTKIRCSSLSSLFTEPKLKADKDAGNLSATAKTHLVEVYASEIWNVEKDLLTKQMKKGIEVESDAISLLSVLDGTIYEKNEEQVSNEWICGHADIIQPDEIIDIKCSYDAFTFLANLTNKISDSYFYQLQGYLWLLNKPKGRISYCLVDTPDSIINGELYRLSRSMDIISEEDPAYKKAAKKLISNMKFSHIPPQHRVIEHFVERDEQTIAQIPAKVKKARLFLAELHEKHMNQYKKQMVSG